MVMLRALRLRELASANRLPGRSLAVDSQPTRVAHHPEEHAIDGASAIGDGGWLGALQGRATDGVTNLTPGKEDGFGSADAAGGAREMILAMILGVSGQAMTKFSSPLAK